MKVPGINSMLMIRSGLLNPAILLHRRSINLERDSRKHLEYWQASIHYYSATARIQLGTESP